MTRIGLITPSSNTVVEPVACRLLSHRPDITVHVARVRVRHIDADPDSARQFTTSAMAAAAELLADAEVDAIAWAGTAGAWLGADLDESIRDAIAETSGTPATTSYLAMLALAQALGLRQVALWTPYELPVHRAIVASLADAGMSVTSERHLGIVENARFADVTVDQLSTDLTSMAQTATVEASLVMCTNVAAATLVDGLEADLHRPVLDSLAATLWHLLCLLGDAGSDELLGPQARATLLANNAARCDDSPESA